MRDPQEYLRHSRGRGKIYGDAEVSLSASLSKDSTAAESCQVRDCKIEEYSCVAEHARVFGGQIYNSYIGGDVVVAGDPLIENSLIRGKNITGSPYLYQVTLLDNAEIGDRARVVGDSFEKSIVIKDSATVYGDCLLSGNFVVKGRSRVYTGEWTRAPRHVDLGFVAITESKLGAMVDCRDRTFDYWVRHGAKLGKRWGWNQKQILTAMAAVTYVVEGK
jgi:carbonic anhydrase/acetyltransferase-like protein (isoleucine patch superfamily)